MEHRLVLTVLAKERHVFAEVHILEVICDKTAIATLNAFAEVVENVIIWFHLVLRFEFQLQLAHPQRRPTEVGTQNLFYNPAF